MNPSMLLPSRRAALKTAGCGFGYLAFAGLAAQAAEKEKNPLAAKKPHHAARAKHVIFLCMEGAPSHVDTFDYKPKLTADDGKSFNKARQPFAKLLGSPWKFSKQGQSGLWMSELLPNLGKHADELCMLNGMHTDVPAHPQAFQFMHTGSFQFKRPSLGAWTLYGLGSDNENLPGFVTIAPPINNGGPTNFGSSFLPAIYQGTPISGTRAFGPMGGGGSPSVSNIRNPKQTSDSQRAQLDFLQSLNREALERDPGNANIEGAIESFELAFRMQKDLPKLMDITTETKELQKSYGIGEQPTDNFGKQCLLARKFVEAGVRFVEVTVGGWDHHQNLKDALANSTKRIDLPIAGLLGDLKQKGLLKDTLVIWGGEFGRTPYAQGGDGRDHNHKGFTTWMAGGGVKGGTAVGKTDEYGYEAVENKIHIHDWHATILHLLGLDHEKLTFRFSGRDFRLTDVKGVVAKDVLA
ncbi:DUF1501 domain-containing protein [Zavarzinella formosa]|uniref:DUF1501 domain-containing protein n=1 Tax=Zavarzinella formosa TaxID=360055 RepID=UPI0002FFE9FB|nr:DUF1501 domain-containing protein [Zavarzinella formosa]